MTWVIWRQYRVSAAIAGGILAAFAVLFLINGLHHAAQWHSALASCARAGNCGDLAQTVSLGGGPVYALTVLTLAVPLLLGMFWGGPAVARERESATVQFAWTQSVTRRRWLSAKVGWLLLAGAVFGGAVAGIVTWWFAPLNALNLYQFTQGRFDIQGIVPFGYAVFAVALGIARRAGLMPVPRPGSWEHQLHHHVHGAPRLPLVHDLSAGLPFLAVPVHRDRHLRGPRRRADRGHVLRRAAPGRLTRPT